MKKKRYLVTRREKTWTICLMEMVFFVTRKERRMLFGYSWDTSRLNYDSNSKATGHTATMNDEERQVHKLSRRSQVHTHLEYIVE